MRLHYAVLLVVAAVLTSADASVATDSNLITENAHSKRLLGSYTFADADGERGFLPSKITNLFKSKGAIAAAKAAKAAKLKKTFYEAEAIQPLINAGASLDDAFIKLDVRKVGLENLDNLIGSSNFKNFMSYMTHFNKNNGKNAKTATQFLRTKYTDNQVSQMLLAATKSSDERVQQLGKGLQMDLLKQFVKTNKNPDEVVQLLPSLTKEYKIMVVKAVKAAKDKEAQAAKFREAVLRRGGVGRT